MVKLCKNYDRPSQPSADARFTRRTPSSNRFENQKPSLRYKRARIYSAQLGRFISRDPLGFVDGMSLYRAYFVPGGMDPSGYVSSVYLPRYTERYRPGGFRVRWDFPLDRDTDQNGYVVQKVVFKWKIYNCCTNELVDEGDETYWESWSYSTGFRYDDEHINGPGTDYDYTDEASFPAADDETRGYILQTGLIKFFYRGTTGPINWPPNDYSGDLPATGNEPDWWLNPPDHREAVGTRSVFSAWNTCTDYEEFTVGYQSQEN